MTPNPVSILLIGAMVAQVILGTENQAEKNAYTFLIPGKSYLEYHINWSEVHEIQLEMTFRTLVTKTMLLHHTFLEVEGEYRPELKVMLNKGVLDVEHRYGDVVERLAIAKGMSHDKWHKIKVTLSLEKKKVTAQVDDRPERTKGLKALVDPKAVQAYQSGPRTSVVFIGGYPPESLQQPSSFVGCFKAIQFSKGDDQMLAELHDKGDLEAGCISACETENPCQYGGRCVNLYTSVECDCFQTSHHGGYCEKEGLTTVTMAGDEWIRYNLYDDIESQRSHLSGIRIAVDFRTSIPEGVLFYASETYPQYNHVAVSLHNGTVHVSVVFEDRETHSELYTTIGKDLNDGRWHSLTLIHEGKDVKIQVDSDVTDMDAKHSHPHLNMPEMIYFAGIEDGYPGIGLRSQQTFLGCVRNLYFNHIAILDHLDGRAYYHGNSPLEYKCQDVHTTSMQYQHDGSYIRILSDKKKDMIVEFEFRTYKPDALLFHTDMGRYDYKGYMKGFLVDGKFELHIVPSGYHGDERQVLSLGSDLNRAQWHTVKIFCNSGMVQLWVNRHFMVQSMKWHLTVGKATYFGYAPDIFDEKRSYIGCMRHIVVQDKHVDPLPLIKSENSVGVSVGSCDLIDWCAQQNPCLNNGLCVSEWFTSYCDCTQTHHEGSVCQFSLLKQSCDDYYLSGDRSSGVHLIDIDMDGSLKPMYVYCELGVVINGRKYGVTQVEHNLQPQTVVRGPELKNMKKLLEYRNMNTGILKTLVKSSSQCRQHLSLGCYQAALGLGKQTMFVSAWNKTFAHVGACKDGTCQCHSDGTCLSNEHNCNCDLKKNNWMADSGYIVEKKELPIMEMLFLQELGGKANITLGPLECMGKDTQFEDEIVMFTTTNSYFDLEGWKDGNMEFIFRTLQAPAILLYQHGQNSSHQDIQLAVELVNDHKLTLKCLQPLIEIVLNTSLKLTSGDWHLFQLNIENNQLRVAVANEKRIIDLPNGTQSPGKYSTRLYVGDKPMKHSKEYPGLVGCFGGLVYNKRSHPFNHIIDSKIGVHLGCQSKCESEPCKNGATCIEHWNTYQCKCSNKFAHSGELCEHNINENSVKFLSTGHHLKFVEPELDVLGNDYYLSFRTNQKKALLLYMFDDNNNFIQMDVEDGEVFHLSYNAEYELRHATVKVSGLTDGNWKQVAVWSEQGSLKLYVDGTYKDYEDERMPLLTYSQVPFKDVESVVPLRNVYPPTPGTYIYVGGVPNTFVGIDGLKGCIRGVKIGDQLLDLEATAQDKDDFWPGCPSGCETSPCKHGGRCFDNVEFGDGYICDCSNTGYAGKNCNGEVGIYFSRDAAIEESLSARDASMTGGYEARLELIFATSVKDTTKTAIGFIRGQTGLSDYMLIYLTQVDDKICVAADVQLQDKTVNLVDDTHTADGVPHRVTLERKSNKITLKVDDSIHQTSFDSVSQSNDNLGILDIGWVRKDNFRFTEYVNFTGDIWNVFFTSDMLKTINARPLEVYNGVDDGNHGIRTMGTLAPVTQSLHGMTYDYMYGDTIWRNGQHYSYPPWNPGPAKTVSLASTKEEEASKPGPSPAIAFVVCGLALFFFLGLTLCLVLRHRAQMRRNGPHSAKSIEQFTDEEEVLLRKINPNVIEGLDEEEPIKTAKLRQGPRKGKSGSGTDDENEETPMLHSEVPMAETAPRENIPMEKIPEMTPEEEECKEVDSEVPQIPDKNKDTVAEDQQPATVTAHVDSAKPPPKPPRLSAADMPEETIDANPTNDQTELPGPDNDINNVSLTKEYSDESGANFSEEAAKISAVDKVSVHDDESGDEGKENIEIKAEVHSELPPDGSLNPQLKNDGTDKPNIEIDVDKNKTLNNSTELQTITSNQTEGESEVKLQSNSIH